MYLEYPKGYQHCSNSDKILILFKVMFHSIWSPIALTFGKVRQWRKSVNVTKLDNYLVLENTYDALKSPGHEK